MTDIAVSDCEYKGQRPFDRDQIEYVVWCILTGALDMIEGGLPTTIDLQERKRIVGEVYTALGSYERGCLEGAGMALSIFYAQLTGEGMGAADALAVADEFDHAIEELVRKSWQNEGEQVFAAIKMREGRYQLKDVLPGWPDCHKHARHFADAVLQDYKATDTACHDETCPFRKMDSSERADMAEQLRKFSPPEGDEDQAHVFADNSYLEHPSLDDPEIRRRDESGNFLDVRHPNSPGWGEWAELTGFRDTLLNEVKALAERLIAAGDETAFDEVFNSHDPNYDVSQLSTVALWEIYAEWVSDKELSDFDAPNDGDE